ncbi:MAG: hypothetical protein J6F30_05375 [Cellulosilyticum sp.]|nr:hypothetical protein [Cellulosilyticum sp.]
MLRGIGNRQSNQRGSTILITTIILLIISLMIAMSSTLSSMAFDLAILKRNTSNTYYLAKSAIEKQVDTMNQALERKLSQIIEEEISPHYIESMVAKDIRQSTVVHDISQHILMANDDLKGLLQTAVCNYLKESYVGADKIITYKVQSDRPVSQAVTKIKIEVIQENGSNKMLDENQFKLIATAKTMKGSQIYDEQVVEAILKLTMPENIENQIHESYEWANGVPDILNSALLAYSDIWVSGKGKLVVKTDDPEEDTGDVRVGGRPNIEEIRNEDRVIYPEVDQTGGVIATNGGQIEVEKNVYCTRNIVAANGWGDNQYNAHTHITIGEDAIAHTIGIVDDFYETGKNQKPYKEENQAKNIKINIGQNAMVDNDVLIERWVNAGGIHIKKTLFGVGGGIGEITNPNQSSGVFSQGPKCLIEAGRMYVAGQPFICLDGKKPMRLWESIGEPFGGVTSWEGYQTGEDCEANASYLESDSPFITMIAADKIKTNFKYSYAIGRVSGQDSGQNDVQKVGQVCKWSGFANNDLAAWGVFFMRAGSNHRQIDELMDGSIDREYKDKVNTVLAGSAHENLSGKGIWSSRNLGVVRDATYEGIKGYMTLMRALFYDQSTDGLLNENSFIDVIDLSKISVDENKWSYATPIELGKTEIALKDYYVKANGTIFPYPTIIINKDKNKTLKVTAEKGKNLLNGWIISAGPVELGRDVKICGGIIVGGPEEKGALNERSEIFEGKRAGVLVKEGEVEIIHNAQVFLDVQVQNHKLYRELLDALQLTNHTKCELEEIIAPQNIYTKSALKYSKASILEINTGNISIQIESLKRNREKV